MYVDAVTTAALVRELSTTLERGRVQSIVQTSRDSLGFEIYANSERHYLLMSIDPQAARCHLVAEKLRRGVDSPSPLFLLLRKNLDGAWLEAIHQPPWERILIFDFSSREGTFRLIVETMDKLSNIILTSEGRILDSLKRIGPAQNRYRSIQPGIPYVPPPAQEKMEPERITADQLTHFLKESSDEPAWRVLVDVIAGVSPLLAREIIHRACDDSLAPAFDVSGTIVHQTFMKLVYKIQSGEFSPGVAPAPGGYQAFAAYPLTHLQGFQPLSSISAAMAAYFGAPVGEDNYAEARSTVADQLEKAHQRLSRKLASLERQQTPEAEIERLKQQGELILAYSYTLSKGQTELIAQYEPDKPPFTIALDPTLTPVENAENYFDRYRKAQRAAADQPRRIARVRHDRAYLDQLATDLDLAESWPEIDTVREALQEGGFWQGQRTRTPKGGQPGARRFTTPDGFVILVGRNAKQNHRLVTETANKDDLWLHARRIPGSHVIVRHDGRDIPDAVIQRAAELAAYYSSARDDTSVDVDVTQRRYVRPIRRGQPGMMTYKNETTLTVTPRKDHDA